MSKISFVLVALILALLTVGCTDNVSVPDKKTTGCSPDMVNIDNRFCIDRYEYPNKSNEYPVVNVDWNKASKICQREGKRLCSQDEWIYACQSAKGSKFPYGNAYRNFCNDSDKYRKSKRKVSFTLNQLQKTLDLLNHSYPTKCSKNNTSLINSIRYFLALQIRFVKANDAINAVKDKSKNNGRQETILKNLAFTAEEYNSILAEINFLKKEMKRYDNTVNFKSLSIKDYSSNLEMLIQLEKNDLYTHEKDDQIQNNKLQILYAQNRIHIISALTINSPNDLEKLCRTNFNVIKKSLEEFTKDIYEKNLAILRYEDIKQINETIIPEIDNDKKMIFSNVLYALERRIIMEYDQEKAILSFQKTHFKSGENNKCITEQGVMDMVGNVYEWTGITEKDATYRGGASNEGSGTNFKQCAPILFTNANSGKTNTYLPDIGFRCCK